MHVGAGRRAHEELCNGRINLGEDAHARDALARALDAHAMRRAVEMRKKASLLVSLLRLFRTTGNNLSEGEVMSLGRTIITGVDILAAPNDMIYAVEESENRIISWNSDPDSDWSIVAGRNSVYYGHDDGIGTNAMFWYPGGLYLSASLSFLYVAGAASPLCFFATVLIAYDTGMIWV